MFKKIATITLASLLLASCAKKPTQPVSSPIASETGYSSEQFAATAALDNAVKISTVVEEAGGIYTENNKYFYTSPASNQREASFDVKIEFPPKTTLVALYHTHPLSKLNMYVSPEDVYVADTMKLDSFIGIIRVYNPRIIEYIPGKSSTFPLLTISPPNTVSKGQYVGKLTIN
jgi:hypothetical protein